MEIKVVKYKGYQIPEVLFDDYGIPKYYNSDGEFINWKKLADKMVDSYRMNLTNYIMDVKSQLVCNADDEYKSNHTTYNYSNEEIDNHTDYFKKCMYNGLSTYKALLYFYDYLNDEYNLPNLN